VIVDLIVNLIELRSIKLTIRLTTTETAFAKREHASPWRA